MTETNRDLEDLYDAAYNGHTENLKILLKTTTQPSQRYKNIIRALYKTIGILKNEYPLYVIKFRTVIRLLLKKIASTQQCQRLRNILKKMGVCRNVQLQIIICLFFKV